MILGASAIALISSKALQKQCYGLHFKYFRVFIVLLITQNKAANETYKVTIDIPVVITVRPGSE